MGCGSKTTKKVADEFVPPPVRAEFLEETGRLQFFYHSPDSPLPVRDVLNQHRQGYKKEPHLEKSAENYCVPCLQRNIRGFLNSDEKYLFLFTRRSNPGNDQNRYIVGYLVKEKGLLRYHGGKPHWAVKGRIFLFSFAQAFLLRDLRGISESAATHLRFRNLDKEQTRQLLTHFKRGRDIFQECKDEVLRLNEELRSRGLDATSRSDTGWG